MIIQKSNPIMIQCKFCFFDHLLLFLHQFNSGGVRGGDCQVALDGFHTDKGDNVDAIDGPFVVEFKEFSGMAVQVLLDTLIVGGLNQFFSVLRITIGFFGFFSPFDDIEMAESTEARRSCCNIFEEKGKMIERSAKVSFSRLDKKLY